MMSSAGRTQELYPIDSSKACIGLSQGESAEYRDDADDEHPGVRSDLARLHARADPADTTGQLRTAVHQQSVDQPGVHPLPEDGAREAHEGLHDDLVVAFVDEIL